MSVDLTIDPEIQGSLNVIEDQQGNKSQLYVGTGATAVATDAPQSKTSLTVAAPPSTTAIATVRPDATQRWHWKAVAGNQRVFTIRTQNGAFQIYVKGKKRLEIAADGSITLEAGGDLTFTGLSKLAGPDVVDLVIDASTGKIGHR